LIATLVGLLVSAIYFYISPFKDIQPELLSRLHQIFTISLSPFFGGLVGAIAITRVEKGNPIPGVAIATAIMPTLCTAGYGLLGSLKFFLGAMYLYSINCVFICISTFFIVKYLKYPVKKQLDDRHQKQVRYIITTLITILILPSIYFAYLLIEKKKYQHQINVFMENEFTNKRIAILYKKTNCNASQKKLQLGFLSRRFIDDKIEILNQKLRSSNSNNTKLMVIQDTTNLKSDILNEINFNKSVFSEKDVTILNLKNQIVLNTYDNKALLAELKILFPGIAKISLYNHTFDQNKDSTRAVVVLIYKSKEGIDKPSEEKLVSWLKQRLVKNKIEIFRTPRVTPKSDSLEKKIGLKQSDLKK
jgi:hypothetical protein